VNERERDSESGRCQWRGRDRRQTESHSPQSPPPGPANSGPARGTQGGRDRRCCRPRRPIPIPRPRPPRRRPAPSPPLGSRAPPAHAPPRPSPSTAGAVTFPIRRGRSGPCLGRGPTPRRRAAGAEPVAAAGGFLRWNGCAVGRRRRRPHPHPRRGCRRR
jgi:hypothetical protein